MTRDEIRQKFLATSIKPGTAEPIDVPQIGTVYIPRLSIRDAEAAAKAIKGAERFGNAAALIVAVVQDEAGERVFTDEDIEAVAALPADVGAAIIAKYEKMNGQGSQGN